MLRRAFLVLLAAILPGMAQEDVPEVSQVYFSTETHALGEGFQVHEGVIARMVNQIVMAATGTRSVKEAWSSLVSPEDVVGIKVSATPGRLSGTHEAVATAIARGLQEVGVSPKNIIVWDRSREELLACGYRTDGKDYELAWIDPYTGYDSQHVVTAPVLGKLIWGDSSFGKRSGDRLVDLLSMNDQLSSQSYLAKILTQRVTKWINVPSLVDSFRTGIHGALASAVVDNIDNWRRFAKPPQFGDPYIAEIYFDPMIDGKIVLTILDGLVLQYAGGPFSNPNFCVEHFSIYASKDPVAIDATALMLLSTARESARMPRLEPMAGHVRSAEEYGLGNAAESRVQLIRVGAEGVR